MECMHGFQNLQSTAVVTRQNKSIGLQPELGAPGGQGEKKSEEHCLTVPRAAGTWEWEHMRGY